MKDKDNRCPRCRVGYLEAVISPDGSAYEADQCAHCDATWFYDPPKRPEEIKIPVQP